MDDVVPRRRFPWVNLVLFALTVLTALEAGAGMANEPVQGYADVVRLGWTFALPLILALGTHEMGHFIVARLHGLEPSWPYFIPAPGTLVGTFGAVIRMRFAVPPTRRQLFDVGIAGPLAGFVVSLVFLAVGGAMSTIDAHAGSVQTYTLFDAFKHWLLTSDTHWFALALGAAEGSKGILLGDSLLVKGVIYATTGHGSEAVSLHPVAFAGWVGMFVTALNLLPVGQLDGGHVAFALLGRRFRFVPWVVLPVLVLLGVNGWPGWLLWAVIVGFIGLRHPPVAETPLGPRRMALAWLCLVIFVLIFTPAPLQPAW